LNNKGEVQVQYHVESCHRKTANGHLSNMQYVSHSLYRIIEQLSKLYNSNVIFWSF